MEKNESDKSYADYIIIEAEENGVTEQTSDITIRGKSKVHCSHGVIESGSRQGGHL